MKPTKLIIKNIGKLAGEKIIPIDKPLILFYGEIKQGKTTILNSVRWVCGGEFPEDIISHGEKEGSIELHFDGGMIARSFYRSKDSTTKARAVTFVKSGRPVPSPVAEIKRLLNPFLLDQDYLRNKTELERKQYFTELFAVDTTDLDTELFNNQRDATALRSKIGGYGEIDLTPVETVDIAAAQSKLTEIGEAHGNEIERINGLNKTAIEHNSKFKRGEETLADGEKQILELETKLSDLKTKVATVKKWLVDHPKQAETPLPPAPDVSALTKQVQDGGAINERAKTYQSNKNRAADKSADENKLAALEKRGREIKAEKQAKLKTISATCGIAGLEFDDAGNFIYDGTTAGMISDSQIMRLSSELSALYPDGFGLDLIDRAESLGKSIFEFVDKAKAENKSILATIVGEKPAKVPADVGVFVVENGKLSTGELL